LSGYRVRRPGFHVTLQPGGLRGYFPRRSELTDGFCQNIKRQAAAIPYAVAVLLFELVQSDDLDPIAGGEGHALSVEEVDAGRIPDLPERTDGRINGTSAGAVMGFVHRHNQKPVFGQPV